MHLLVVVFQLLNDSRINGIASSSQLGRLVSFIITPSVRKRERLAIADASHADVSGPGVGRHPHKGRERDIIDEREDEVEHTGKWSVRGASPPATSVQRVNARLTVAAERAAKYGHTDRL